MKLLGRYADPGELLDIGCSAGQFLAAAREESWQPLGVELSEDTAELARRQFGGPVVVLGGEDPLLTVTASFDRAQADRVAAMTADGRLTIVCARTMLVANSPALQDCRIEQ